KIQNYFNSVLSVVGNLDCKIMSDSILVYKEMPSSNKDEIEEFIKSIINIQFEVAKSGHLLRGAMTYGDFYHDNDKDVFVGPALSEAYTLETKFAKFPRVIISSEFPFKEQLKGLIDQFIVLSCSTKDKSLWGNIFDDAITLNWLHPIIDHSDPKSFYDTHLKTVLEKGLDGNQSNLDKYLWLRKFYIEVFHEYKDKKAGGSASPWDEIFPEVESMF
ncbi:MAG: hypothetical protein ACPGJV_15060, partial [Bacteriovoracaceae bacterium]